MEAKRRKLKAIASVLCLVFCCFLLIFGIIFKLRFKILSVQTDSMSPSLNVGDYLIIIPQNDYSVGDVVAFEYNGLIITHRLVKIENENYILKGDNAKTTQTILKHQIMGRAKKLNKVFKLLIDLRFLLLLPITFCTYTFIKNIKLNKN